MARTSWLAESGGEKWIYHNPSYIRFVRRNGIDFVSVAGKLVESKINGLNYRNCPSWSSAHVVGNVDAEYGFTIDEKVMVDG
ncbi:hypothetical protein PDN14_22070 [Bacillus cereus group sp. Bc222]|uniref:hypothetical protein n=1 Tax=Bacillus cereus group sp. Bc222 TaxID=3018111 RepID=UPI0022E97EC1|nr:hypothetical protein [Bacillus cereus group sp. Bc222]MDA2241136.1 hypothetical protein [Bacillus cereus group sp. Bc222]